MKPTLRRDYKTYVNDRILIVNNPLPEVYYDTITAQACFNVVVCIIFGFVMALQKKRKVYEDDREISANALWSYDADCFIQKPDSYKLLREIIRNIFRLDLIEQREAGYKKIVFNLK